MPLFIQLFCNNIYLSLKIKEADLMKTVQLFYFYFHFICLTAFYVINYKLLEQVPLKKIDKKFLTEPYFSLIWLSSILLSTMNGIRFCSDKKLTAN